MDFLDSYKAVGSADFTKVSPFCYGHRLLFVLLTVDNPLTTASLLISTRRATIITLEKSVILVSSDSLVYDEVKAIACVLEIRTRAYLSKSLGS